MIRTIRVTQLLLAALAGACTTEVVPATQLVVGVQADPSLSSTLKRVRARFYAPNAQDGSAFSDELLFALADGQPGTRVSLPKFSFGLARGKLDSALIVLEAYGAGDDDAPVIEHKFIARFEPRRAVAVTALFNSGCYETVCAQLDQTCALDGAGVPSCQPVTVTPGKPATPEPRPDAGGGGPPDGAGPLVADAGDAGLDAGSGIDARDAGTPMLPGAPPGDASTVDATSHPSDAATDPVVAPPRRLAAGYRQSCLVQDAGTVVCWGASWPTPTSVLGLADALGVSVGENSACAFTKQGSVHCWSFNGDVLAAEPMTELKGVRGLAVGARHRCALVGSGQVYCWGENYEGQLGNGKTRSSDGPSPVVGVDDAVEVAVGGLHSCARRATGAVSCWGNNQSYQLGDGATSSFRVEPVSVVSLSDAVEIAAPGFGSHTCARRSTGDVVCWGYNEAGQLGEGSTVKRSTPQPVSNLHDALELALGADHSCARRAAGDVVCWGENEIGQLGSGTLGDPADAPVSVELQGGTAIAAGATHTCALLQTGAVSCWGSAPQINPGLGDGGVPTPTLVLGVRAGDSTP